VNPDHVFVCNKRRYRLPAVPTMGICLDGTAPAYLERALADGRMPHLARALKSGGHLLVARAQVPTVTNVNNASILTGVNAASHGISGNRYVGPDGEESELNRPEALRADTILATARQAGVSTLAVTAKEKLRPLISAGGVPAVSAERADEQVVDGAGPATSADVLGEPAPDVYDPALSLYALDLALALSERLGARLVYCSLSDFVAHKAGPGEPLAQSFYGAIDERLGRMLDDGWRVGLVADHGMNAKSGPDGKPNVHYLMDVLEEAGIAAARVLAPIADRYVRHHASLGSIAFVYVDDAGTLPAARSALAALEGVEAVLDRAAAARAFQLPSDRIGDLVVCADAATVLGTSADEVDLGQLSGTLRSHGGLHEQEVPLVICHPLDDDVPSEHDLQNADLYDLLLNRTAG
jgi:phosphonoacetate hydrolase